MRWPRALACWSMYKVSYWLLLMSCVGVGDGCIAYAALVGFALIMGVGYGVIAAMTPAVAAARFGIEGLGELLGFLMTGFGVVVPGGTSAGRGAGGQHARFPVAGDRGGGECN